MLFSFIPLLPQTLGFCDIEFNVQVGLLTIYNDHGQQWNNCCSVTAGIGDDHGHMQRMMKWQETVHKIFMSFFTTSWCFVFILFI